MQRRRHRREIAVKVDLAIEPGGGQGAAGWSGAFHGFGVDQPQKWIAAKSSAATAHTSMPARMFRQRRRRRFVNEGAFTLASETAKSRSVRRRSWRPPNF